MVRVNGASALALVCLVGIASANTVTLTNSMTGVGHLDVTTDDFGSFGRWIGPNDCDNYWPPAALRADPMSNVVENLLFITAAGHTGGVALTGYPILHRLLQGPQGTGIEGDFANLTRSVPVPATVAAGVATSAIAIADTASGVALGIGLSQRLAVEATPASRLEQDFTITNNGTVPVSLVWHAIWDMNCLFTESSADNDFVGVGQGLCYVYMHNPGTTTQGGALGDGGSQVGASGAMMPLPISAYVALKAGQLPEGMSPAFSVPTSTVANQQVWLSYGMPATWVNEVPVVGKNIVGENNVSAESAVAIEYKLTLAPGEIGIIKLRRHWGTVALPCTTIGALCGNNAVDSGETCDSATDTPTCNAGLCTAPTCGDNYQNTAAGEQCESNQMDSAECDGLACTTPVCGDGYPNAAAGEACDEGVDSATCNLTSCQPPACGDGIVNAAAGEECETGELCDIATCKVAFTIGGGCAGCGASGGRGSLWLAGLVAIVLRRRRRR